MRLIDADVLKYALGSSEEAMRFDAMIDEMPTISTRLDWTPCAEGLPESGIRNSDGSPKMYRVTVVDRNGLPLPIVYQCDASYEYDTWITESSYEFEDWETVTAWFELPAPYNPDRKED